MLILLLNLDLKCIFSVYCLILGVYCVVECYLSYFAFFGDIV